jgi:hypothetical protein
MSAYVDIDREHSIIIDCMVIKILLYFLSLFLLCFLLTFSTSLRLFF